MKEADIVCPDVATFLGEIIKIESIFYERLFLREKFRKGMGMDILKINLLRYFYGFKISDKEENGWSGNLWYSYALLGGRVYELRSRGISDGEIYQQIIKGRDDFLKTKNYPKDYLNILMHHHCREVYDAMVNVLEERVKEMV